MDAATKLQADREYVDRFFHGVASKLMTHPYFSKFANQTNIAAEVPASAASLGRVLAAVAEKKEAAAKVAANAKQLAAASAEQNVVRTAVSLDTYKANMEHVRKLFEYRSTLLQKLKTCPKAQDKAISAFVQQIDDRINAAYASGKPQGVDDIDERIKKMECTPLGTDDKGDADVKKDGWFKRFGNQLENGNWLSGPRPVSPPPSIYTPNLLPETTPPLTFNTRYLTPTLDSFPSSLRANAPKLGTPTQIPKQQQISAPASFSPPPPLSPLSANAPKLGTPAQMPSQSQIRRTQSFSLPSSRTIGKPASAPKGNQVAPEPRRTAWMG